jgi:hypothetical protein
MSPIEIHTLVEAGGESLARQKIKKLAIPQRMGFFRDASPWIPKSPKSLAFYRKHFAQEIGALLKSNWDLVEAERLFRAAQ